MREGYKWKEIRNFIDEDMRQQNRKETLIFSHKKIVILWAGMEISSSKLTWAFFVAAKS